jgi:hypothetical protein
MTCKTIGKNFVVGQNASVTHWQERNVESGLRQRRTIP